MDKFLFTDGTSGVKELQSEAELNKLVSETAQPEKIRIWLFNTHEWISYADYKKRKVPRVAVVKPQEKPSLPNDKRSWLTKALFIAMAVTTVILVYNFTRIKWTSISTLQVVASRADNVPLINTDSLVQLIEAVRGQKLDKVTRANLRIRNTWPERIFIQANAERDSSSAGVTRINRINFSLDNATGYLIDKVVVKWSLWEKGRVAHTDTFHLTNIGYATPATYSLEPDRRGDSLSISFSSIKSKAFNFCYSADKQSNYGNLADRWFCKD